MEKNTVNTVISKSGNTTSDLRTRAWIMVWNNYTKKEAELLVEEFIVKEYDYIIGYEIGKEGTPHLQIYFYSKNPIKFLTLKKRYPKCHIEKANGSKRQNFEYCSKDGNYVSNMNYVEAFKNNLKRLNLSIYKDVKWYPWQRKLLKKIEKKTNNRSINWIYDKRGNAGKSFICKYIVLNFTGCIIADGKKSNIFNQVKTMLDNMVIPRIILLDIPRYAIDYVNFGAIEKLKDGLLYSGKYEGGVCVFPIPKVFIFANYYPDIDKLSADRWMIYKIDVFNDYSMVGLGDINSVYKKLKK